jgi:site-specific DNA recombinase
MSYAPEVDGPDLLGWWIRQTDRPMRARRRPVQPAGGLRFAFYGRISTEDFQDRLSSARWQRDFACEVIAGRGRIVAEFFDVGCSRRLPWADRPQAALLLARLSDPGRGFDAIVVGEFERAFYGDQFQQMAPMFAYHGVQVWLPELDGPVDAANELHLALLTLLGVHSRREVQRARFRAKAAMQAQVTAQGRHLGGRPPYGFRLADAGPHPNRAHARWGRRAHRLEPDPETAPRVEWMFAQRLAGRSVAAITRDLNQRQIPCPSRADPDRNPHRSGHRWTLRIVAAILANPRYAGRQVWNRQRTDRDALGGADDLLGQAERRRWNVTQQWVISKKAAHPALVSEEDFVAAQQINAVPAPDDRRARRYLLVGLIRCRVCGRMMDSHWVNNHASYRCRHGNRSTTPAGPGRPRNVYIHEAKAIVGIAAQLRIPDSSPQAVADYLRIHGLIVTCAAGGHVVLEHGLTAAAGMTTPVPRPRSTTESLATRSH